MLQESHRKLTWQAKVTRIGELHAHFVKLNPGWSIRMTANETYYSVGTVAEALMVYSWLQTHPYLANFPSMREVLEIIRAKKMEMKTREYMK